MLAPNLIFAIGNESRGDDAIAPLLLRKLASWLKAEGIAEQFELLEDFQLQIEHATDMVGREMVLFIDAGMDTPAPYTFYRIESQDSRTLFSHAITPEAVLSTYRQVYHLPPPAAFILCIRGERFELGEPPSPEAEQRLELAMVFLQELIQQMLLTIAHELNPILKSAPVASALTYNAPRSSKTGRLLLSCRP